MSSKFIMMFSHHMIIIMMLAHEESWWIMNDFTNIMMVMMFIMTVHDASWCIMMNHNGHDASLLIKECFNRLNCTASRFSKPLRQEKMLQHSFSNNLSLFRHLSSAQSIFNEQSLFETFKNIESQIVFSSCEIFQKSFKIKSQRPSQSCTVWSRKQ